MYLCDMSPFNTPLLNILYVTETNCNSMAVAYSGESDKRPIKVYAIRKDEAESLGRVEFHGFYDDLVENFTEVTDYDWDDADRLRSNVESIKFPIQSIDLTTEVTYEVALERMRSNVHLNLDVFCETVSSLTLTELDTLTMTNRIIDSGIRDALRGDDPDDNFYPTLPLLSNIGMHLGCWNSVSPEAQSNIEGFVRRVLNKWPNKLPDNTKEVKELGVILNLNRYIHDFAVIRHGVIGTSELYCRG